MAVTAQVSSDGHEVTINVSGRFDFSAHQQFRRAHEENAAPGRRFVVNLKGAEYMDSSALGMLLVLREQVGGESNRSVRITNCRDELRTIFSIANFDKLFAID